MFHLGPFEDEVVTNKFFSNSLYSVSIVLVHHERSVWSKTPCRNCKDLKTAGKLLMHFFRALMIKSGSLVR